MELKELLGDAYKEGMTVEDITAAIAGLDLVDRAKATEGMVPKSMLDRANSEAAENKRKLKEKMSAEEVEKAERETATQKIMEELETLRHDKAVSDHTARFVALGYDEKLAKSTAEAMVKQDFDTVFANQQTFLAARDKDMQKKQTLNNDKRPPAGDPNGAADYIKLAAEAASRGDFVAQAYYTRLAQVPETK